MLGTNFAELLRGRIVLLKGSQQLLHFHSHRATSFSATAILASTARVGTARLNHTKCGRMFTGRVNPIQSLNKTGLNPLALASAKRKYCLCDWSHDCSSSSSLSGELERIFNFELVFSVPLPKMTGNSANLYIASFFSQSIAHRPARIFYLTPACYHIPSKYPLEVPPRSTPKTPKNL
jgi:hypothetical protein